MPPRVSDAPPPPPEVRRSGVHGRGVYATGFIPEGTRVIEYTGQRTSWEDAPDNENDSHTFNFGLENGEVINPEIGGNEARWLNHSCNPNCESIEEDDRIFIYAMRDIEPGEELFYDYALVIDEPITKASKKEYECLCGSSNCRGTMLALAGPSMAKALATPRFRCVHRDCSLPSNKAAGALMRPAASRIRFPTS